MVELSELCVNSCHPARRSAAAPFLLTESAHRLAIFAEVHLYVSDGHRGPLAALTAAVLLEVTANSHFSQNLVYDLKNYVSDGTFVALKCLPSLRWVQVTDSVSK